MGNPIEFDWLGVWVSFASLVYFGLIVLAIYLIVSTIKFLKHKTHNDKEIL